jgi:hypothetical protein
VGAVVGAAVGAAVAAALGAVVGAAVAAAVGAGVAGAAVGAVDAAGAVEQPASRMTTKPALRNFLAPAKYLVLTIPSEVERDDGSDRGDGTAEASPSGFA